MVAISPRKLARPLFYKVHKLANEFWLSLPGVEVKEAPPPQKHPPLDLDSLNRRLKILGLVNQDGTPEEMVSYETGDEQLISLPRLQELPIPERHLVAELIDQLEVAYAYAFRLGRDAYYDPLTNLKNRRATLYDFNKAVCEMEINEGRGQVEPVCIAMFDADKLKEINDKRDYESGDVLINHVGRILKEELKAAGLDKEGSSVARYGGDEFVAILRNTTPDQAHMFVERIEEQVREQPLQPLKGLPLPKNWETIPKSIHGAVHELDKEEKLLPIINELHGKIKFAKSPEGIAAAETKKQNTLMHSPGVEARLVGKDRLDVDAFSPDNDPDRTRNGETQGPDLDEGEGLAGAGVLKPEPKNPSGSGATRPPVRVSEPPSHGGWRGRQANRVSDQQKKGGDQPGTSGGQGLPGKR
jgi:diguanylate cyclase (GGDEF)-like protein